MAEWSKAVDLRPTIFGCAGSNPADDTISLLSSVVERTTLDRVVAGSIPAGGLLSHGPGH